MFFLGPQEMQFELAGARGRFGICVGSLALSCLSIETGLGEGNVGMLFSHLCSFVFLSLAFDLLFNNSDRSFREC